MKKLGKLINMVWRHRTRIVLCILLVVWVGQLNYWEWESDLLDFGNAGRILESTIALEELLIFWDKEDGVPADSGYIKELEVEVEKNKKKANEIHENYEYLWRLSFLSKITYAFHERHKSLNVSNIGLSLDLRGKAAFVAQNGKNR